MDIADTIYSLAEEAPRAAGLPDRDDRSRLQPGAVGRGSLREICFLKRITPLGAVLCMEQAPKVGERLDLELLTGDRLRGCVEWVQGSDVGLRFDEAADMFALITRNLVHQTGDARRMPPGLVGSRVAPRDRHRPQSFRRRRAHHRPHAAGGAREAGADAGRLPPGARHCPLGAGPHGRHRLHARTALAGADAVAAPAPSPEGGLGRGRAGQPSSPGKVIQNRRPGSTAA
jgi:hypothetical protein